MNGHSHANQTWTVYHCAELVTVLRQANVNVGPIDGAIQFDQQAGMRYPLDSIDLFHIGKP